MNISVGLGSTLGLTTFMSCIGVDKLGFGEEDVRDVLSLKLNMSAIKPKDKKW
jgi:hypothetical protein